jgi:hypothetical protein
MAGEEMSSAEAVPHMVLGTRVPFWKGFYDWKEGAFYLASPLLVLWSARWFFGLIQQRGHLLDDGHVGDTVVGVAFFSIVAIIGVLGIRGFFSATRDVVLESACPCCGARQIRNFGDPSQAEVEPLACGTCLVYLRAKGLEVTEERIEAITRNSYVVPPARYLPVIERDSQGHFAFQMPPMCAGCGSTDAPHLRDIAAWGRGGAGLGFVGTQMSYTGVPGRDGRSTAESQSDLLDAGLRDLKVPVCVNHTRHASLVYAPFEYKSGGLVMASYRFYKAFCALNRIDRLMPPSPSS